MKAILVIDIPKSCAECSIFQEGTDGYCPVGFLIPSNKYEIAKGCPLKPMPEKREENLPNDREWTKAEILAYSHGINRGWNLCLEELEND